MLKLLLAEPAARTSNEADLWTAIPDAEVTIVAHRDGWGAHRHLVLPQRSVPFVGGSEGWTAAPAWLRGLSRLDPGPIDAVISLELFSFSSAQCRHLARRLGVPHIVAVAETMADNPIYKIPPYRQITRRVNEHAALVVCDTALAQDHAITLGVPAERTAVVHLAVDSNVFTPARDGLTREPVVLYVGMLRADRGADKGVVDIVHACERAKADHPDLRLLMVGEGHLKPELDTMAATRPWMTVVGRIPRDEMAATMRSARALILASKRTWKWEEQFGFVLVEAMSCGLPVVGTRSGAIPEVVAPGNGLADEGDVAGLAAALSGALGPDGEAQGRRNREHVLESYDRAIQGQRLRAAVEPVIHEFRSARAS